MPRIAVARLRARAVRTPHRRRRSRPVAGRRRPGSTPILDRDDERDLSLLLQSSAGEAARSGWPACWLLGAARDRRRARHGRRSILPDRRSRPQSRIWAPGAGHQDVASRRSLPTAEFEVRLYGCQVGIVELPPWVRLVAAGCTFDAGARDDSGHPRRRRRGEAAPLHRPWRRRGGQARGLVVRVRRRGPRGPRRPRRSCATRSSRAAGARHGPTSASFTPFPWCSLDPTGPGYLVLAENNGPGVLAVGEGAATPGAYGERGEHERELRLAPDEFLPIGMDPVHVDRTTFDLYRMERR